MGQIDRLKRITMARIEAFLDSLETPELILPQLLKELSDNVNSAVNAEAKSLTAVKAAQRRLDEATGRVLRFEKGATRAVVADEIETARQALAAQIEAEQMVENCQRNLDASSSAHSAAHHARIQLQNNLKQLRSRKKEILNRSREAGFRKKMQSANEKISIPSCENILDAVSRIEARIDLEEATVEVQNNITHNITPTIPIERIEQLENDAEINRRLDQLRKLSQNETQ